MHLETKRLRRRPIHLGAAALILVIVGSLVADRIYFGRQLSRARETARRAACMSNLKLLVLAQKDYANDHGGKFSENLSDLYPEYVAGLDVFSCPSTGGPYISSKDEIDSKTSYVLRKGLTEASRPDEVLLYEKPENHRGEGGNVAYIDGHVRWLSRSDFQKIAEEGPKEDEDEPGESGVHKQAFYYCINCKQEFTDSLDKVPPIGCISCGQLTAVLARKFACRRCGEVFIGYMEKFDPETKALIEARKRGEDVPDEQIRSILVSKPGQINWVDAASPEGLELMHAVTCPNCKKLPARIAPVFPEPRRR